MVESPIPESWPRSPCRPGKEVNVTGIERVVNALLYLHPLHALIVHFPIALASVGLLAVVLALWRRSEVFEQFAFFNVVLTAASTAAAGLTGFRDHLVRFDGETPYVNVKIFLGVSLLVLSLVMAVARWRNPDLLWNASTRILYTAGFFASFALAAVLGFVGGAILYGF